MASEKNFENAVKRFLRMTGCWYIKYWSGGGYTRAGVPDLLICAGGHFIGAELKAETGRPTELQLHELALIRKAGGIGILLFPQDFQVFRRMILKLQRGEDTMQEEEFFERRIAKWMHVKHANTSSRH